MSKKCSTFALEKMTRKTILHIVEWAVTIAAYALLTYKLATYEHYDVVGESLRAMGLWQWLALGACLALMPVNMLLEAWRWQTLIHMPLSEAQRQVYYSKMAGLITPWRLGEYPARGLLMSKGEKDEHIMPQVLSMGAVGSATMTAAIVAVGAVALSCLPALYTTIGRHYLWVVAGVILLLFIALGLAPHLLRRYAEVTGTTIWISLGQSVLRLACWCIQLGLVLYALKALEISDFTEVTLWLQLPVYYLLVTITPNIPIAEVGVRGFWAMLLFGTVNATLAGVVLWGINTLLPCLCWLFIRKEHA